MQETTSNLLKFVSTLYNLIKILQHIILKLDIFRSQGIAIYTGTLFVKKKRVLLYILTTHKRKHRSTHTLHSYKH